MSRKPSKEKVPPSRTGSNTKLVNIEDLIHLAMGPPNINIVNFKMLEQVLFLLAQHMRVLEHQVEIQLEDLGPQKTTGAVQFPGQVSGQAPGQILEQMVPGQIPGQVVPGQVPGSVIPGQTPGQLVPGQISGQVPGSVIPGQTPGQLVPGQISGQVQGQVVPGQVPGQMISGQVPGQVVPGQAMVPGQVTGQIPGQVLPGQVPEQLLPGQIPGVPGQITGQMLPGQVPGHVVPGQSMVPGQMVPGQVTGQIPGQVLPGKVPEQLLPGQIPGVQGQITGQMSPGQVPGHVVPGQIVKGQVSGQIPGQIPGLVAGQGPGQISGGEVTAPGLVQGQLLKQVPGGALAQVAGQVPAQVPGRIPGQAPGLVPGQVSGQVSGQIQGQLPGQVPGQVPGVISGELPSQIQGQVSGQIPNQMPGLEAAHMAPREVQGELLQQEPGRAVPGQISGQVPGQVGQVSGQIPGQVAGQAPGEISRQEQGQVSELISGLVPGQIPGQEPGQITGQISGQIAGQTPGQEPGQIPEQIEEQIAGKISEQISGQSPDQTPGQVLPQKPGKLPEEVLREFPEKETGKRAPGSAPRPGHLAGDEIRKVASAVDVQRRRSQIEKVRSPTYVGSVEVVTREEFDELQAQIKELEQKTALPPAPRLPDTKELMERLARGSASLTDTMVAMQLASRVQAAESAIGNLAGVITELAVEGGIPADLAGILSVSESTVEIPCITKEEMEEELNRIRLDMLRKIQVMIDEAVSSAQKATKLIQDMNEKIEVAMDLSIRMEQLQDLVAQYTLQLQSSDQGIASQMQSFQEQVQLMRDELKKAVTQLQQVNDNAETASVMELTVHYDNLVHEMETTKAAHAALEAYQLKLDNEIRVLVEAIEQMKEEKADRDEVLDGLRDKADVSQLEGLLSEDEFQRAREALEQKLSMCYDKFRRQDNVWMNVVADFNAITENKAELVSLVSLRDQVQEELRLLHRKAQCLADMLGDPKAAIMCRQVSIEGSCAVCRVPALMEPTVPAVVPQLPALLAQVGVRPQPTGAEADAEEEPVCVTSKKLFKATDSAGNPELERHICKRWVGGSHTLIGAECGRGNVARQRAEEIYTRGVIPTKRYEASGTDGKMYKCEEGLLPCEECNQLDIESELPGKLPCKADIEADVTAVRVKDVDPSLARRVTVVDDRDFFSVKEERQTTCECGRETDYMGQSETRDGQWRQSDVGHLASVLGEGFVSHMGLVDAARHRAKGIVEAERSKLDTEVGVSVRGTSHVVDDQTVSRMQLIKDFDVILGPHRGEGEGQETDDEK